MLEALIDSAPYAGPVRTWCESQMYRSADSRNRDEGVAGLEVPTRRPDRRDNEWQVCGVEAGPRVTNSGCTRV